MACCAAQGVVSMRPLMRSLMRPLTGRTLVGLECGLADNGGLG